MYLRDGLLLRGLRWRLGTSLLTVLTATIAVATAVLGPLYLHTAGDSVVRRAVSFAPAQATGVSLSLYRDQTDAIGAVEHSERELARAAGVGRWLGAPIT